jgi:exopolyphosphatase/guanosine-5'-triphosphate,3'-diphosphate pyrophosphatase
VEEQLGFPVRVISAAEEAYYTYLSVRHDLAGTIGGFMIVDIGGGSTEIIEGSHERFGGFVSFPVGSVKLTEMFIKHDPPWADEIGSLRAYLRSVVKAPFARRGGLLFGTAGTITNLASLCIGLDTYDKAQIHGLRLNRAQIDDLVRRLANMTVASRREMPGMEKGREDILLQGIVLLQEIMSYLSTDGVVVNANGVRFGVLYQKLGP